MSSRARSRKRSTQARAHRAHEGCLQEEIAGLREALAAMRTLMATEEEREGSAGAAEVVRIGGVIARIADSIVRAEVAEQRLANGQPQEDAEGETLMESVERLVGQEIREE